MKLYNVKDGVSVVECIAYCALLALLSTIVFNWIAKTHTLLKKQSAANNIFIGTGATYDLLARELRAAPSLKSHWKKTEPTEIIWRYNDMDIGWMFEKGLLVRSEGSYSQELDRWSKRTKSIVSSSLKSFAVTVNTQKKHHQDWVKSVQIMADSESMVIALRNGMAT